MFFDLNIKGNSFEDNLIMAEQASKYGWDHINFSYNQESYSDALDFKDDLNNVWTDEYGVIYSSDRTRILKAPTKHIKRGNHNWTKGILSGTYSVRPGTTCICDRAFLNCCDLNAVILPQSVKQIGARSFQGCFELCAVELNDGLIKIGDNAFRDCKKLHSIHLPKSLEQVGNNAFYGCTIKVTFSNFE